jgi:group I intron endonuclease
MKILKDENILTGIYKITNLINNRVYIGSSFQIGSRWKWHLYDLKHNIHKNKELQNDFNKYGITNFEFQVIKEVNTLDKVELLAEEQLIINEYDFKFLYNTYHALNECQNRITDEDAFIDYINNKWLFHEDNNINDYKIWTEKDRNEIVDMAIKCNLFNLSQYRITFSRVIKTMEKSLGYNIKTGAKKTNKKRHAYKLIVSFDKEKINFEKPFK